VAEQSSKLSREKAREREMADALVMHCRWTDVRRDANLARECDGDRFGGALKAGATREGMCAFTSEIL